MNRPSGSHALRPTVRAVRITLATCGSLGVAGAALAQDATVESLTQPESRIEIGIGSTSSGAYKAHEYDGLTNKGGFGVGAFDVRGGGRYDSNDATRWRIFGNDLGTRSRSLGAEISEQGKGRFSVSYDELQHNVSDSYQTPLLGVGSNTLTMPGNWLIPKVLQNSTSASNARGLSPSVTAANALVSGLVKTPTAAQLATMANIQSTDLGDFHQVNLATHREKIDFAALVNLDRRWEVSADMKHEHRNGLQQMAAVSAAGAGELSTVMPYLIDQDQDQVTLGVNYTGDRLVVQAAYYGSLLANNVPGMSWQGWGATSASPDTQPLGEAPSNQLHQFSLQATYRLGDTTRLAGGLSYGRNTQNDAYITNSTMPVVPVASLNGLVVNTSANLKLTARPTKALNVAAAYKYDERENKTPVNTYVYNDIGLASSGTSPFASQFPGANLGSASNINANRAYSKRTNDLDLEADYAIAHGQTLRGELEGQRIDRWCGGSWIACADADHTNETTMRLDWILRGDDKFSGRVGYARSQRTVDYNEDAFLALVPMANQTPTGAPAGSTAYNTLTALGVTGYGPVAGLPTTPLAGAAAYYFANNNALSNAAYGNVNRISELPGMRRFNMADRGRDKLRASAGYQASEALSLQATLDYNRDHYSHSVYGLQDAQSTALNLDAAFTPNENTAITAYLSYEDQRSRLAGNSYTANSTATAVNGFTAVSGGCFATIALRNASNKIDPCLNWFSTPQDVVTTIGINGQRKNLMAGKLDVSAGFEYMAARSSNGVSGGNYFNNPLAVAGAPAGTVAAFFVQGASLPVVSSKTVELRLGAQYHFDKSRSVRVGYMVQHMTSDDYAYQGLQPGGLSGVLPTFQQAPSYNVNTVVVVYVMNF